jgi:dCMP deaminase
MRPDWDEYFIQIARQVATRGTCPRASVGAVVVLNKRILTTGYNGASAGTEHCSDVGCLMVNDHCLRTTHAEANAIVQGALHGVALAGSTIYTTHQPCAGCTKLLISAGITRVVYDKAYPDSVAELLMAEAGVTIERIAFQESRV